ncbi:hypothetical protein VNO77_04970 [Canavalia gladiata]|uniref:VQ domain-containing protein n=1 Tax=Canavalia gladiata TaxID=3824 RepID=A0AAN9MZH9_CANGL
MDLGPTNTFLTKPNKTYIPLISSLLIPSFFFFFPSFFPFPFLFLFLFPLFSQTMDSKSPRMYQVAHHHSLSSNSSSSSNSSNGLHHTQQLPPFTPTAQPPPSPYPPKPVTRSESASPYPTTFVQADTSSFKQVVQMLTGSTETAKQASSSSIPKPNSEANSNPKSYHNIPPIKTIPKKQQQQQSGFKLYERRNTLKSLNINPLLPIFSNNNASGFSPRKPEVLSPSILDFPALVLSPVTPLIPDPFDRSRSVENGNPALDTEAEDKAIKEKGFFLHPSPATTPRDAEPRLLPLFPTTSPRPASERIHPFYYATYFLPLFPKHRRLTPPPTSVLIILFDWKETTSVVNGDMEMRGSGTCDDERKEKMGGSDGNEKARKHGDELR